MESRLVRRRSSQASKDDEAPFMTAQEPTSMDSPKEKATRDSIRRGEVNLVQ